ncbi:TRP-domain-containing protein [Ascodesmis nigricans]|uniref:TRP-domain-containing protein n=1 Tax=Ascodesmis nigricans TaxID=341454 RepID=A0A4V6RHF4_9PEZI|nr:TRP-domain-containing protein [Ascodesmis nigricans]
MRLPSFFRSSSSDSSTLLSAVVLLAALSLPARAADVLRTNGFSTCIASDTIIVNRMDVEYDRNTRIVTFDVSGTSTQIQEVTAVMTVTVYGREFYRREFDPCDEKIEQLCPVPSGTFAAKDQLEIPTEFASQIPGIAFQIPDLDGIVKLKLLSKDNKKELACLASVIDNGKSFAVPEVKVVTAIMAAGALGLTAVSAVASGGAGPSPGFVEIMFLFQGIAMDGMLSIGYPKAYRSFSDNFAWSTGLVSWEGLQRSIDNFRKSTGGNLDQMSIDYLLNSTLIFSQNANDSTVVADQKVKRNLQKRIEIPNVSIDGTNLDGTPSEPTESQKSSEMRFVEGVQAKVETLKIPSANTFMTVLLIFCIVLAGVAVCILLFKVILEVWALFATFPKSLTGFRKRYWTFLMTTIVRIILILYGTWTLYCLYQFKNGDSWGAHILAGVTLAVFSVILGFFAFRIFSAAREVRKSSANGEEELFLHKPYLRKYGLFYDQYKSNFWWVFFPLILYAFAKGAFIALGDGHGLVQTVGQLACEALLLALLLWNRPYNTKAGNVLNIIIACVRVLSVVCLIVFVDQLGIAADTKTVTGVALIVIQATLTAVLAICLIVNAIRVMVKENPHKKRRKELEKQRLETGDNAFDPENSILSPTTDGKGYYHAAATQEVGVTGYGAPAGSAAGMQLHHMTPAPGHYRSESAASRTGLMGAAGPMAGSGGAVEEYRGRERGYQAPGGLGTGVQRF